MPWAPRGAAGLAAGGWTSTASEAGVGQSCKVCMHVEPTEPTRLYALAPGCDESGMWAFWQFFAAIGGISACGLRLVSSLPAWAERSLMVLGKATSKKLSRRQKQHQSSPRCGGCPLPPLPTRGASRATASSSLEPSGFRTKQRGKGMISRSTMFKVLASLCSTTTSVAGHAKAELVRDRLA